MADNVIVNSPTTTGATIATEDVGGVQHQKVIIETTSADGEATPINATNPLPVVQTGTPALPTGAAIAANQQTDALTNTQLRATPVPVSGTVTATPTGTQNVDVTANTIGLATGAKQDAQTVLLTTIDADTSNLDVALSTRLKPADTLAGVTTVAAVTAITNALPAGTNLLGRVGIDQTTPGTTNKVNIGTDGTVAINAALPTGANIIGAISNTAFTANAGTNLNTSALALESGGNLATLVTRTPVLGATTGANSSPVVQSTETATGNITTQNLVPNGAATANSAIELTLNGASSLSIQTTNTYTGALSIQLTNDNSRWETVTATSIVNTLTGAYSATIASAAIGLFQFEAGGFLKVRVTALAAVTGTATITLRASNNTALVAIDNSLPTGTNSIGNIGTVTTLSQFPSAAAAADALANPTITQVGADNFVFNGTTWDRRRTANADAQAATGIGAAGTMIFNGSTWDRARSPVSDSQAVTGIRAVNLMLWNGSTYERSKGGAADGQTGTGLQGMLATQFNGSTYDRARSGVSVSLTTADTGAKVATGNGNTITNIGNKGIQIFIILGTVSGTLPTATFKVQGSVDNGTNWFDIPNANTASLTASTNVGITIYPGLPTTAGVTTTGTTAQVNAVIPRSWRMVWTIGGTTPSFAITSITYNYMAN